ncbi:MAG: sigma-70 family RNA polymerase sigma factor [Gemmataceae bacterium]|nr:sigma-70 family RNA polymerase sigma factor [Gemmataceae bacterium]
MANSQFGSVLRYISRLVVPAHEGDRTDGQLLEAFAARCDPVAFEALVKRYAPLVWGVCRRILPNDHEAEDVFQGTFLVLVRKSGTLDRRGSLANWLHTVAYHLALKTRMQSAKRRTQEREAHDMPRTEPAVDDSREELHAVLDEELHRLPDKYRGPLVLCYLHGKTNEEAARELGRPMGSMSRHLDRGRELLRKRLIQRGVALSAVALVATPAPAAVVNNTVQAGLAYAAGQTAAGILSAEAVTLAEGLVKATAASQIRVVTALILAFGLIGTGAGVLAYRSREVADTHRGEVSPPPPLAAVRAGAIDDGLALAVEKQIALWQPTPLERRIDEIGWANGLRDAQRLAKEHGRPIFLLVHSGDIATGRSCAGSAHLRASGLSNDRGIELLNRYFIPVYIANQDFAKEGTASLEERAAWQQLRQQAVKAGVLGGTSWVYILSSEGVPIDSYHGCQVASAANLIDFLEWHVLHLNARQGKTLVEPRVLSRPPQADADTLVLHLTARYLKQEGDARVPLQLQLGESKDYGWRGYPAENWLVLPRERWLKLLPSRTVRVGTSWVVDPDVSDPLLRCFYPQTEENDLARNRIDDGWIMATVAFVEGDRARIRLDGTLRMKHRFSIVDDDHFVDANVLGTMDVELGARRIRNVRLFTPHASYGGDAFGVAVRSLP